MKKIFMLLLFTLPLQIFAATECEVSIRSMYTGDSGYLFLFFTNGGSTSIPVADQKNVLSIALTAITSGKKTFVRYVADNAPCTSLFTANTFRGLWLGDPY